jgi:aspartyl aminopeptidase
MKQYTYFDNEHVEFPRVARETRESPTTNPCSMVSMSSSKYLAAQKFVSFVNASPTPFHAVKNASVRLEKAGFTKLLETDESWDAALKKGGRFYYTRSVSYYFIVEITSN